MTATARAWLPGRRRALAVTSEVRRPVTPAAPDPALITQRAAQLEGAVAYLSGHLILWEARGQLPALDGYLDKVSAHRRTGSLPQYREYADAVKAAAMILRPPAAPEAAEGPMTGEMWRCPDCGDVFDGCGVPHEPCSADVTPAQVRQAAEVITAGLAAVADVTPDPSGSEAADAGPAAADSGDPPSAAGPGPEGQFSSELDPDDEARFAIAFGDDDDGTSETSAAGAGLGSPPAAETPAPGPEADPAAPGPGAPDEVPDFADRDEHEPALDQDGTP